MGNCSNKTESSFNLYDTFKNTGMQEPWAKQYENNFEKDYYMAVNVFRAYPSKFISIVRELRQQFPDEFKSDKSLIEELCGQLKTL